MLPLPSSHQLPNVYDRSGNPSHKNYDGLLFDAGRRSQGAEMTELQQLLHRRIDGLGAAIFADGDVIEGGNPVSLEGVDGANVRVHAGKVYIRGRVYDFDDTPLMIPTDKQVSLGVRLHHDIVDYLDDPTLLNPAVRRAGYMEPGAYRAASWVTWNWKADDGTSDGAEGDFFPVYSVDNGTIIEENSAPMADIVYKALRRYDFDGNGSYVSGGLRIQFISESSGDYQFQVEAGSAHILGDIVERKSDSRMTLTKDPDENISSNEYHIFTPDGNGRMNVPLSRPPVSTVMEIIGQKRKTASLTRGFTANGKDIIDPSITSIVSIISVKRGGTTYVQGADFARDGDEISWAPAGQEPAGGETYEIVFEYTDDEGVPEEIFPTYLVLSGYAAGTPVLITYKYKLPRIDLIVLKHNGTVERLRGAAALVNPAAPQAGPNEIALATVEYDWFYAPKIRNIAVRAVHMSDLEDMRANIFELFRMQAQEKLRNDANQKDPTVKFGVFVDSFKDDSQRDNGLSQTAAIVDGFLTLPINAEALELDGDNAGEMHTLPFAPVVAISQPFATQCGLINPYQTVAPPDAIVTLTPSADSWTIFVSAYTSQLTKLLVRSSLVNRLDAVSARRDRRDQQLASADTGVELVSEDLLSMETSDTSTTGVAIRQRDVVLSLTGFRPLESVVEAFFDGVPLPTVIGADADADGKLTTTFFIPPNIPTGIKLVSVLGSYGTMGEAVYSAAFSVIPNPPPPRRHDPLAQTFVPTEDMQVCGADIKFCKKGSTQAHVTVQVREVINGYPGPNVLAEGRIDVDQMNILNALTSRTGMDSMQNVASNTPSTVVTNGAGLSIGSTSSGAQIRRGMIKFTLPSNLIGATVFSAKIKFRQVNGAAINIGAHRLRQAFTAGQATWLNRSTSIPWDAVGGSYEAEAADDKQNSEGKAESFFTLDVKNIVEQWAGGQANYGIILRHMQETTNTANVNVVLRASDAQLEIVYRLPGGGLLGEGWTRVMFPVPAFLRNNVDYALTLLTTDASHSVSFARLGDAMLAEQNNGAVGFVSRQPYPVGLLFDSSNNVAWTARQADDLTFRILRAEYSQTEQVIDLGDVDASEGLTDLMMRAPVTRLSGDTNVTFDVTFPGGVGLVNVENMMTWQLRERVSGNVNVKARIKGTNRLSPILYARPAVIVGDLGNSANYFTKKVKASATFTATAIFNAFLPSGASVQVAVASAKYTGGTRQVIDGVHQFEWLNLTLDQSNAADDGFTEQVWKLTGVRGITLDNYSQLRIIINGSPAARALIKDLQFFSK